MNWTFGCFSVYLSKNAFFYQKRSGICRVPQLRRLALLKDILLRFRESRVSLCADIEKAFLQISVDPPDRDFLRFLWVDNIHGEYKVDVYRFSRVVFGVNASPFLLNGTIRHHLSSFAIEDPSFVQKMIHDFYVDDLITGENTVGDAYTLYEKARDRMACGGFRLRKWLTNDAVLRAKIQLAEKEVNVDKSSLHELETFAKTSLAPYSQGENSKAERVFGLPCRIRFILCLNGRRKGQTRKSQLNATFLVQLQVCLIRWEL